MFERFTDRARRVVVLAQEEARTLDHNYIGTEHILLGLLHEGTGAGAKALESLGISLEDARGQVTEIIGQGQQAPSGHIPFTPRAKKVLELSLREALHLGHQHIGPGHLLLGLIREGKGVGAQVLVRLDVDPATARARVIELLRSDPEPGPAKGGGEAAGTGSLPTEDLWGVLSLIADRLTAIERHLGMRAEPAASGPDPPESPAAEPASPSPTVAESPAAEPASSGPAVPESSAPESHAPDSKTPETPDSEAPDARSS